MSGICGIILNRRALALDHLAQLAQALSMTESQEVYTTIQGPVGMGAQPFLGHISGIAETKTGGRRLILAFYGDLYNRDAPPPEVRLKENCLKALLLRYDRDGISCLQHLRGEFALALWDEGLDTLYLATDRFRVHPLFYYQDHDKLVFSSRMSSLLASPLPISLTINAEAIVDIVGMSFIPTPKTIFQNVKKIPPGNVLTYHHGTINLASYWDINFLNSDGTSKVELTQKLKARFADAISVRLKNEQNPSRIGTFLSGGIDSSTVTGVLKQQAQHPIKSFSIGFDEDRFNETSYSRIVANAFQTNHYEYFVTPQDVCEALPKLLDAFDEPYANASAIPTFFCANLAREHDVECLYAGDGGDELFAGNERYAIQRLFDYYGHLPNWPRDSILKPLVFTIADSLKWSLFVKGKKYIQRASTPYPNRLAAYSTFEIVPMHEILTDGLLKTISKDYNPYEPLYYYYLRAPAHNNLDRQLYIDLKLSISDNDLFKVTRATEAAGVTVRYPFLDHCLAEYAASVPAKVKMRGRRLRSFFKDAYADLLPMETLSKTKHGFGLPISLWLRTDKRLNDMMHDLVLSPQAIQRGYFRKKTLEHLIASHKTDETSFYGTILWNLITLELWLQKHASP